MVSAVSGTTTNLWALQQQKSATSLANSIFSTVDTDNKGYIDKASLTTALSDSGTSSTDIDQAFSELDQDGDGKVTKSELSTSIDQLSQALSAQFNQSRVDGARADAGGGDDPGFTKDELTAIAGDSQTDAKQSAFMSKIAENFDSVDTDGDGRVTGAEAMAYAKSTTTDAATDASSSDAVGAISGTPPAGGPPPAGGAGGAGGSSSASSSSSSTTYAAADTNQDGTVSLDELLAYETKQSNKTDSSSVDGTDKDNQAAMRMLKQLLQAYGNSSGSSSTSTVASTDSISAYA
ncbi:MAG: EF-hand domain-containing protein [Janthinobacterium lividum]